MYARWCFTVNNPSEEDETRLQNLDHKYLVFGRETGDNGTRHLQGFIILNRSQRLGWIQRRFGTHGHWEQARGTNRQASDYCKKDGDYFEHGEYPEGRGERSDLRAALDELTEYQEGLGRPITTPEVARVNPVFALRNRHGAQVVRALFEPPPPQAPVLREWQGELEAELDSEPDNDRCVLFYVDPQGNAGKSFFCRYYIEKNPDKAQYLSVARASDLAYAVDPSKSVFLINAGRGHMEFLSYPLLEAIKDKMLFSGKYQSQVKRWYKNTHVVVFSNEYPDMNKLSEDRYIIREINSG